MDLVGGQMLGGAWENAPRIARRCGVTRSPRARRSSPASGPNGTRGCLRSPGRQAPGQDRSYLGGLHDSSYRSAPDRASPALRPDPAGAAVVQELLGGKFGEMSTFMNYTFQSFNFRARQEARPFFDLVSNIAAEEFGHIELVSTTINTMLTGAGEKGSLPSPQTSSTRSTSSPAARARSSRTPTASPGTATTSRPRATSSRTSRTTSSSRPARATASSRSTRWSTIRPPAR